MEYPAMGITQVDARYLQRGRDDRTRNELSRLQLGGLREAQAGRNALREYMPAALEGDRGALGKLGAVQPEMAMKVKEHLATMDSKKRDLAVKEAKAVYAALQYVKTPEDWARLQQQAAVLDERMNTNLSQYFQGGYNPQEMGMLAAMAGETIKYGEGFEADPLNPGGVRPTPGGKADPAYIATVEAAKAKAKGNQDPATLREIDELRKRLETVPANSEAAKIYGNRLLKLTSATSPVTVDMGGETSMAKTVLGRYEEARGNRAGRRDEMSRLSNMLSIASKVDSGTFSDVKLKGLKAMQALGMDVDDTAIATAELFKSRAIEFVLDHIQKTKGAISERENVMFTEASINLGNTPKGNALIAKMSLEALRREDEVDKHVMKFISENKDATVFEIDQETDRKRAELAGKDVFTKEEQAFLQEVALKDKVLPGGSADDPMGLFTKDGTL